MNWLDKTISFISPKWGAKREAWRQARELQRSYNVSQVSPYDQSFAPSVGPAEFEMGIDRDMARRRARALEQNSDVMQAVLSARQRNIIGDGFIVQARTPSEKLNEKIEGLWRKWCRARNCDVTGQQSLMQMLRMAVIRKTIDGGVLFVKRYTRHGIVPFSLQMFEVDALDAGPLTPRGGAQNRVANGVEYDQFNRPVGYWLQQFAPDGMTPAAPMYVKAKDVIFYFTKDRPTQLREMSDVAQTALRIAALDKYVEAETIKHKIMACLAIFIESDNPVAEFGGRLPTNRDDKTMFPHIDLIPGMVRYLKAGQKAQVVNPTGQATDATAFVKMLLRLISSGMGMSYEAVSRDLSSTNYSSARQGAIEDGIAFAEDIEAITEILDEIFETFVISAVQSRQIEVSGFWEKKDEYLAHEWIRRPKPWIDPVKEANAIKIALQSGVKTFKQIAAENGMDWRDQMDDIEEMLEYGEKLGIDIGALIYDGKLTANKPEPEPKPADTDLDENEGHDPGPPDAASDSAGTGDENAGSGNADEGEDTRQ